MSIKILFFASLKERVGARSVELELPEGTSAASLKARLAQIYPSLAPAMASIVVAINHEFAADEELIPDGAEVALFPPVSGGAQTVFPTLFSITEDELDLDSLLASITLPTTGAACLFTGMVRAVTQRGDAHKTTYLEYEAYQSMAEEKMRQVAEEIRSRWPAVEGIAVVQRIGRLKAGTPTVLIACTSAHRDTGVFEAARYGIDRLKEIVPVWKKEIGPHGEVWLDGDYLPKARE